MNANANSIGGRWAANAGQCFLDDIGERAQTYRQTDPEISLWDEN